MPPQPALTGLLYLYYTALVHSSTVTVPVFSQQHAIIHYADGHNNIHRIIGTCVPGSLTKPEYQMSMQELYSTVPCVYQLHCPARDALPRHHLHMRVGSLLSVSDMHIKDNHPPHTQSVP